MKKGNDMSQQTSDVRNFTRGGQITLHNIRMFMQIMNKVALISIILLIAVSSTIAWVSTTQYERYVFLKYIESTMIPFLNDNAKTDFREPNGMSSWIYYHDIQRSDLIKQMVKSVSLKLIRATLLGLLSTIIMILIISKWLKRRGASQTEHHYLKGDSLVTSAQMISLVKAKNKPSDLFLSEIPLPIGTECSHLFFHGTTGTGKSNAIKQLLEQIRQRGDRAIIYDKSCNYLEEFFIEHHDILLNPLDSRGSSWHLWLECRDSADYDSLAAAQIPMPLSTQDPFWVNAARTIFSSAAFEMRNDPKRNVIKLLRYLLTADLEQIQHYLKGTEAETLVSEKIEKTAISIKSVLATYLKSMKYIKDEANPFSIRRWIQNDQENNWLFITSLGDRHETLKPLISSWLDIAVNALLSLPPNQNRRIWLILDELTSLQQLPYLTQTLSEARKFGGCIIIGIQNYAQLAKVYGAEGAREISALLNTRLMFRQPDPDLAKWSALNLGETIMDEVREGISYGANTMRDGISINRIETRKPVVTFSEIMRLPDLQAYLRLPGDYPITTIHYQFKLRNKVNETFIVRPIDENQLKEVDELIDRCEKIPLTHADEQILKPQVKGKKQQKKKSPIINEILPT